MTTITVPISDTQKATIDFLVKSGKAANKAHAVRMAIDLLAREEALARIREGEQEIKEGKTLRGDLDALAAALD